MVKCVNSVQEEPYPKIYRIPLPTNTTCKSEGVLESVSAYSLFQQATNQPLTDTPTVTDIIVLLSPNSLQLLVVGNQCSCCQIGCAIVCVHSLPTILLVGVTCCVGWKLVYSIPKLQNELCFPFLPSHIVFAGSHCVRWFYARTKQPACFYNAAVC